MKPTAACFLWSTAVNTTWLIWNKKAPRVQPPRVQSELLVHRNLFCGSSSYVLVQGAGGLWGHEFKTGRCSPPAADSAAAAEGPARLELCPLPLTFVVSRHLSATLNGKTATGIPLLYVAFRQQKLLVLWELAAHGNLHLAVQGAGDVLLCLRRMGDGSTCAAFPLALCQGWYLPGTKVTDAERRLHPLAAASCMKHAVLMLHQHGAGFSHLPVSLRSPVAGWHSRYTAMHCKVTTWVSRVHAYLEIWHVWAVTFTRHSLKNKKMQSYVTVYAEALNITVFPAVWITKLLLPHIYLLFFMLSEQLSFSRRKGFYRGGNLKHCKK